MAKTFTNTEFHLVFATARRRKTLRQEIRTELYRTIAHTITARGGKVHAIGGVEDHVHIDLVIPVDQRACDMVAAIKSNSSTWMRQRPGGDPAFRWQKGYSLFSVCASHAKALRSYINSQEAHHALNTAADELATLLRKHDIEFVASKLEADGWFV